MERDKRGRFVKKANTGTELTPVITNYKKFNYPDILKNSDYTLKINDINENISLGDISLNAPLGLSNNLLGMSKTPNKLKYYFNEKGIAVDQTSKEIPIHELNKYEYDSNLGTNILKNNNSAGVNDAREKTPIKDFFKNLLSKPVDKEKLANFLELGKYASAAAINKKMTERSLAAEKPFLQDISESHHSIYGDYRSLQEGLQSAAQLRNIPILTSDGALLQQKMMEALIKGNEYINQGNATDDALIKLTMEASWAQEKENLQNRQAVAMQNRQAMLKTQQNKADIQNTYDSSMLSKVIDPLISSKELRLRNEAIELQKYLEYYRDKMIPREVLNTFNLTDAKEQAIRTTWVNEGYEGVLKAIANNIYTQEEVNLLSKKINDEILKRLMEYRGVSTNSGVIDRFQMWKGSSIAGLKTGGTIYKAKLVKRTRDNDRAAKSIESSKKIALKFLEKTLDSLYTYNEIELIAKAKRKYQAGGGIPYVGATPIFATSEKGDTSSKKKETSEEGLSTKDIMELIMQAQILPSDADVILADLKNFTLYDYSDPYGLTTSADITSRYINIINKVKKAQANREWYDKTFDKLSKDGILNEYAITSKGLLIGMNQAGDFLFFDPNVMTKTEFYNMGYQILTNNNLLDIRAKYPMAAFNHNMILEVANGIGMPQITDFINDTIQNLGSDKKQSQIFGDNSKEALAGLRQLQLAAQESGLDLSISQMYEANVLNESLAILAQNAILYLWNALPSNMKSLILAKTESKEKALEFVTSLVNSKLSSNYKLEFSPKSKKSGSKSGTTNGIDGLELSPALMLLRGYGERETIVIQNNTSTGLKMDAVKLPVTKIGNETIGSVTLEDISRSQYGGILDFNNASMGEELIPFEGRSNVAVDGSKIYSMYLPIDQNEFYATGKIVPDLDLVDKLNEVNLTIKEKQITDISEINSIYEQSGLPTYMNDDGSVVSTSYRRFGVLNGTAINRAFGVNSKILKDNEFLKEVDDENIINGAIDIMNQNRNSKNKIEFDGGWFGDDIMYQGTIFIPISNDVFSGIAGSGKTITSEEAEDLYEKQQLQQRVNATYINPGELQ